MRVSDLTKEQRQQVLDHMERAEEYNSTTGVFDWLESNEDFLDTNVSGVIVWDKTTQGFDYWNDITTKYERCMSKYNNNEYCKSKNK